MSKELEDAFFTAYVLRFGANAIRDRSWMEGEEEFCLKMGKKLKFKPGPRNGPFWETLSPANIFFRKLTRWHRARRKEMSRG